MRQKDIGSSSHFNQNAQNIFYQLLKQNDKDIETIMKTTVFFNFFFQQSVYFLYHVIASKAFPTPCVINQRYKKKHCQDFLMEGL